MVDDWLTRCMIMMVGDWLTGCMIVMVDNWLVRLVLALSLLQAERWLGNDGDWLMVM